MQSSCRRQKKNEGRLGRKFAYPLQLPPRQRQVSGIKRTVCLLAFLITLLSILCCRTNEQARTSHRVVIGQITSAITFDPYLHDEESTYSTLSHFYNTLVTFGPDMQVLPELALRWETVSDTVWRFHLRPGVVFHDGRPFESEDVVVSFRRARDLPGSRMGYYLQSVKNVRAIDNQTIEVDTSYPSPVLLNKLTFVDIVPRESGLSPIQRPIGTGPYRFASGTPGGSVECERFPQFWGPAPAFDHATIIPLPDAAERAEAVSRGKADLVARFPEEYWERGRKQKNMHLVWRTGLTVTMLAFSMAEQSPFADLRVRQAISLAIDRDRIAEQRPMVLPMGQVVPPGVFGYSKNLGRFTHDSLAARKLLSEAQPTGSLDAEMLAPISLEDLAKEIARQLGDIGIRLRLTLLPWTEFVRQWPQGRTEIVLLGWGAGTGDASDALDALLHSPKNGYGGYNFISYSNPQLDHLIELSDQTVRPDERQKLFDQIMMTIRRDAPLLPIIQFANLYAVKAGLDWSPRQDRRVLAFDIRPSASSQ